MQGKSILNGPKYQYTNFMNIQSYVNITVDNMSALFLSSYLGQ